MAFVKTNLNKTAIKNYINFIINYIIVFILSKNNNNMRIIGIKNKIYKHNVWRAFRKTQTTVRTFLRYRSNEIVDAQILDT